MPELTKRNLLGAVTAAIERAKAAEKRAEEATRHADEMEKAYANQAVIQASLARNLEAAEARVRELEALLRRCIGFEPQLDEEIRAALPAPPKA